MRKEGERERQREGGSVWERENKKTGREKQRGKGVNGKEGKDKSLESKGRVCFGYWVTPMCASSW